MCVDDGCIPKEKPIFVCKKDGVQDACAKGSICLHHSCYIACDPKSASACKAAAMFNECKPVTTSSGTYHVCGSTTNLGDECDPTRTPPLDCSSGKICIDGYCR